MSQDQGSYQPPPPQGYAPPPQGYGAPSPPPQGYAPPPQGYGAPSPPPQGYVIVLAFHRIIYYYTTCTSAWCTDL